MLERQLTGEMVRFAATGRVLLAALLYPLRLRGASLDVVAGTSRQVLRWRRDLVRKRRAAWSGPVRRGRPHAVRSIDGLIVRLVRGRAPGWGTGACAVSCSCSG